MHNKTLYKWKHAHHFNISDKQGEDRTKRVVILTLFMMVIEIAAGQVFNSMALLADGWHMGTHAAALGITLFAYKYARQNQDNPRYTFGTGKVGSLGGFASAVVLAVIALFMAGESVHRFFIPKTIQFNQAIIVAVIGLLVNLFSAFILRGKSHSHGDHHAHRHAHHHDHNLKAAYLHVLADALTSVLAIAALLTGKSFGWVWMDPLMGIVGAIIITRWSVGLLHDTSRILLDSEVKEETVNKIRKAIEADSDNKVCDLHVWRVSSEYLAAIVSVVTHHPESPEYYKKLLEEFKDLAHVSVEVHKASGASCNQE